MILSTKSTQKRMINIAAAATELKILPSHGANAHSHPIVIMETNKTNLHENVAIVVDFIMLLTKICVQCEEKPATLAEKLVILLMFVDQNLATWPLWKLMKSLMKNMSMFTPSTIKKTGSHTPESLKEELKSLFGGIGKVQNKEVKLHIDPDVTPQQQPHRRIPFHV